MAPEIEMEPPPCPAGFTCVSDTDMAVFLPLLAAQKCRTETLPEVTSDSITIIVDKEGRIYGSGSGPHPYTIHISWCNYDIEAKSDMKLQVGKMVEPEWGFRVRLKATFGLLAREAVDGAKVQDALDGGLLLEPFYFHWANVNVYVGVRSLGGGLGFDLTDNFGLYGGYALTWATWRSNPFVSFYFAF
jgi:hypothetical protein